MSVTLADIKYVDDAYKDRFIGLMNKRDAGTPLNSSENSLFEFIAIRIETMKTVERGNRELEHKLSELEASQADFALRSRRVREVIPDIEEISDDEEEEVGSRYCCMLSVACAVILAVSAALLIVSIFIVSPPLMIFSCLTLVMGASGLGLTCCLN